MNKRKTDYGNSKGMQKFGVILQLIVAAAFAVFVLALISACTFSGNDKERICEIKCEKCENVHFKCTDSHEQDTNEIIPN